MKYIVTSFAGDSREHLGYNLLTLFQQTNIPAKMLSTQIIRNTQQLRNADPALEAGELTSIYDWYTGLDQVAARPASIVQLKVDPTWIVHKGVNHKLIYENKQAGEEYHVSFMTLSDAQIREIACYKGQELVETLEWDDRGYLFARVKVLSEEETQRTIYHVSGSPVLKITYKGKHPSAISIIGSNQTFTDEDRFVAWTLETLIEQQASVEEWLVTDYATLKQTQGVQSDKKKICCDQTIVRLPHYLRGTNETYYLPTQKSLAAAEAAHQGSSCTFDWRPFECWNEPEGTKERTNETSSEAINALEDPNDSFFVLIGDTFSPSEHDELAEQFAHICQEHPQVQLVFHLSTIQGVTYWRTLVETTLVTWKERIQVVYRVTNEQKEVFLSKSKGCLDLRPNQTVTYLIPYLGRYERPCLVLEGAMTEEIFHPSTHFACRKETLAASFTSFYQQINTHHFSFATSSDAYCRKAIREKWGTEGKLV